MLDQAGKLALGKCGTGSRGKDEALMRRRWQNGSLKKIGGNWIARWWEDCIREDGRPGRIRRYANLGGVNREKADEELERLVKKENGGCKLPRPMVTFKTFVHEQWAPAEMPLLDAVTLKLNRDEARKQRPDSEHRPASADTYASKLRTHLIPYFGQKRLCEITRYDVELFLAEKARQGHSPAHVRAMCATLSRVMQAAVRWKLLEENPAQGLRQKKPTDRQRPAVALTPEQVKSLADALPEPCRTVVLVAVLTGLRIGEILGLRWISVNLQRGTLSVDATLCDRLQVLGPTKTRSSTRTLSISGALRAVLEAHGQRCSTGVDGFVFTTPKGTALSAKNLRNRVLEPVRKALELPRFSWHDLRHTHATWLSEAGVAPKVAQEILGHSDASLTLGVYTHVLPGAQRAAMDAVAAQLDAVGRKPSRAATGSRGFVN